MTEARRGGPPGPARHQVPDVDVPALALAREVRRAVGVLRSANRPRWVAVMEPLLEPLQDGDLRDVWLAANRVRSTFGVGESVAEELPDEEARALLEATDAVLRALDRHEAATLSRRRSGAER